MVDYGLFVLPQKIENVFEREEAYFKQAVAQLNFSTRVINREIVVEKCLSDVDIVSNFISV